MSYSWAGARVLADVGYSCKNDGSGGHIASSTTTEMYLQFTLQFDPTRLCAWWEAIPMTNEWPWATHTYPWVSSRTDRGETLAVSCSKLQ